MEGGGGGGGGGGRGWTSMMYDVLMAVIYISMYRAHMGVSRILRRGGGGAVDGPKTDKPKKRFAAA